MAKRRKPGTGSVHLRKDGRWEGRVVIGYDENGLPKTKNVLTNTKSSCVEKLKELQKSLTPPTPTPPKPKMTVKEWLDHWYQTYKKPALRPNTQMSYEQRIYGHIIPALGDIPIEKLTQNDLQQFYNSLKLHGRRKDADRYGKGLSDATVRGCHTTFRSALDKAVDDGLIPRNPSDHCKLPSAKAREMQVLTPEEMQRLLIQAKEDGCFELFLLELCTGLRRGEILALQWDDLNPTTGELHIERQVHRVDGKLVISQVKTKASNRSIVLPPAVVNVLLEHQKAIDSRWMFPSPVKEDSPLDPASVRKRLQTVLDRAGCKKIRFHDLRHTFATTSLEHGMDIKTLSDIIGHVSTSTTLNIYAHVTDEMRRTAAVKINQGIAKAAPTEADQAVTPRKPAPSTFQAYKGQRRKPGTGCVSQINENLWEGRYSPIWPDGKKHPRNIYAHSLEECENKLVEMIEEVKAEIAREKERIKQIKRAS